MNEILWKPKNVNKTKLKDFTDLINDKYALDIDGYQEFIESSTDKLLGIQQKSQLTIHIGGWGGWGE